MKLTQTLELEDYRTAAKLSYGKSLAAKIRLVAGIVLLALGALLFFNSYSSKGDLIFAIIFLVYGLFLIFFAKRLWIFRSLKNLRNNPNLGREMQLELTQEGVLKQRVGQNSSNSQIAELYAYLSHPKGMLLYMQKNLYIPLKQEAFASEEEKLQFESHLRQHGLVSLTEARKRK